MQELILLQHVEKLGRPGGIVRVKNGYAQNYLLPRKLAVISNRDNLRRLGGLRQKFEVEEKERIGRARTLAEQVSTTSITIPMKASDEGHLYGSVSVTTIVEALREQGIQVDSKWIRLAEPIKEIGRYEVPLQLHDEVRCDLKVWVVEERDVNVDVAPAASSTDS